PMAKCAPSSKAATSSSAGNPAATTRPTHRLPKPTDCVGGGRLRLQHFVTRKCHDASFASLLVAISDESTAFVWAECNTVATAICISSSLFAALLCASPPI